MEKVDIKKSRISRSKIGNTRIIPVTLKILAIFITFILVSNLSTNYINIIYNRSTQIKLMRQLLVKDLRTMYSFCNTQYEIYEYSGDLKSSMASIAEKGKSELKNKKAIILGIKEDGEILFQSFLPSSGIKTNTHFGDKKSLNKINKYLDFKPEGAIEFKYNKEKYFGIYKYNLNWDIILIRAEELNEFYSESRRNFWIISFIILIITLLCTIVGMIILNYILRFIKILSNGIMNMIRSQELDIVDLSEAPNDDITFLGVAFNSLSNTIDNLVSIFRKFANREIVTKAYEEKEIHLDGRKQELTILFSDIKSFTFITETLGTDIIKLLNMHYDNAIQEIINNNGIIGSIIGDAILAMFGTMKTDGSNKSVDAVITAYRLQEVSKLLRTIMNERKKEIVKKYKKWTSLEEKVYRAVLLEIGVGIDGGEVFYGNIGSHERMTNTVIGDNVNAASRLEGLTRIYKVPVICSKFVKNDIENYNPKSGIYFLEIDTVQVKGKTIGKKVYWPIPKEFQTVSLKHDIVDFEKALELYYKGNWKNANKLFKKCKFDLAREFEARTTNAKCPGKWNGIWTMKTK